MIFRGTRVLTGQAAIEHMAAKVATVEETARYGWGVKKLWNKRPAIAGAGEPGTGYTLNVAGAALVAATAKTLIAFSSSANTPVNVVEFGASADATSGFLLIEMCWSTAATAGTVGTAPTTTQIRGPAGTLNASVAGNYTAEPTVLTRVKAWRFPMPGGPFVIQHPLGREPNSIVAAATSGKQVCFRFNASVAVTSTDAYVEIEE